MTTPQPTPATIAREAFKQLATQRIAPTPENYARVYARTARVPLSEVQPALAAIEAISRELAADPVRADLGRNIADAIGRSDWGQLREGLRKLCTRAAAPASPKAPAPAAVPSTPKSSPALVGPPVAESEAVGAAKTLFTKTLEELVHPRLGYTEPVVEEARDLAASVTRAHTTAQFTAAASRLKQLWVRLELRGEGPEPVIRALHGLLQLLLRNMADLVPEDAWFQGQVERVKALLGEPISPKTLTETERCFKEFAYRQDWLRATLEETQAAIKDMMTSFIARLGTATTDTDNFSRKLVTYNESIRSAKDLRELSGVMDSLLQDTQAVQSRMANAHSELEEARARVEASEARVRELEASLEDMQSTEREDPLTLALNRRGLELEFCVEVSRARRRGTPLAIAVLVIDRLEDLGERLGEPAAEAALKHLAQSISQTIRPSDALARHTDRALAVLLPETGAFAAETAMNRVQQELARRRLALDGEEIGLTVSWGIAVHAPDETMSTLLDRASAALHEALNRRGSRGVSAP